MKDQQKGFALVSLLVIIGVLIVSGGFYYYSKNQQPVHSSNVPVSAGTQTQTYSKDAIIAPSPFPSPSKPVNNYILPNPRSLTIDQFKNYPECITNVNRKALPAVYTCTVGQEIGYYNIVKSINSNNTISLYVYSVQPAQYGGETWAPRVSTYSHNQVIINNCGEKMSVDSINYSEQNFSLKVETGDGACAQ